MTPAVSLLVAFVVQDAASETPTTTRIRLPDGRDLELEGLWSERRTMWGDTALLFDAAQSYDGGASSPRTAYSPKNKGGSPGPIGWSSDGASALLHVDEAHGIALIDVFSGRARSRLRFPTHTYTDDDDHCDPRSVGAPQFDPDRDRWIFVVQEESNDEVTPWQRDPRRSGGHWLAGLSRTTGKFELLSGKEPRAGEVVAWALAPRRGTIYEIVNPRNPTRCILREVDLQDRPTGRLSVQLPCIHNLALSSDERWLLLERRDHTRWSPACPCTPNERWKELQSVAAAGTKGFLFLDLERLEVRAGPDFGHEPSLSPDGRRVAFLNDWELWLHDRDSGATTRLARHEPPAPGVESLYWTRPAWSLDGSRLAACIGGTTSMDDQQVLATIALDLTGHELFVIPDYAYELTWSPASRPFWSRVVFAADDEPVRWSTFLSRE